MSDDGASIVTLRKAGRSSSSLPRSAARYALRRRSERRPLACAPASAAGDRGRGIPRQWLLSAGALPNRIRHGRFTFEGRVVDLGPPVPGPHAEHRHG